MMDDLISSIENFKAETLMEFKKQIIRWRQLNTIHDIAERTKYKMWGFWKRRVSKNCNWHRSSWLKAVKGKVVRQHRERLHVLSLK